MTKLIRVFYANDKGEIVSLSYDSDKFTVDTAEQSVRDKGLTVIYSTTTS